MTRCREKGYECSINTVKKALGKPTVKRRTIFSKDILPQPDESKPGKTPPPKRAAEQIAEGKAKLAKK